MSLKPTKYEKHPYIGKDKPTVEIIRVPDDKFYWQRRKAAKLLHTDENNLEDEPDIEPADWTKFNEKNT